MIGIVRKAYGDAFAEWSVLYFPNTCGIAAFLTIRVFMSVKQFLFPVLLAMFAQGCGQTGPLYLPDGPAPIYVPKDSSSEEQ